MRLKTGLGGKMSCYSSEIFSLCLYALFMPLALQMHEDKKRHQG